MSPRVPQPIVMPAWAHAAFAFGCVALAATLGSLITAPNIPGWYAGLAKPAFAPPNAVFGPVWSVLYAMMGYAFFRILRLRPEPARDEAAAAFLLQLALNATWSFAFFGARSPALGAVVIVALLAMIGVTVARFRPLDRLAALLLLPYVAWVGFATLLNLAIWWINP